jgi:hypothetical protein
VYESNQKLLGLSFWLQIQRSRVLFPALPDFLKSSGSGTGGPLSLVSTIEELPDRKSSGSCLENRYYGLRGSVALTTPHSPTRENWY